MNIVYSLTRNVYEWLIPSVRSLAEHNPDADVFILCEDNALPYELPIQAKIINVSKQNFFPEIAAHRTEAFGGFINHLKVRYPDILPVDKVIHLDIDTIICDSLTEMWSVDIDGKWFAAVPEVQTWYRPYGEIYYNMGVAVINLVQMREDGAADMMSEFLLTTNQPFADQNAWNRYAQDKAAVLHKRFNESPVTGQTDKPAIIHYCSIPDWWSNKTMDRVEYLERYK